MNENFDIKISTSTDGVKQIAEVKFFGSIISIEAVFKSDLAHKLGHILLALTDEKHHSES